MHVSPTFRTDGQSPTFPFAGASTTQYRRINKMSLLFRGVNTTRPSRVADAPEYQPFAGPPLGCAGVGMKDVSSVSGSNTPTNGTFLGANTTRPSLRAAPPSNFFATPITDDACVVALSRGEVENSPVSPA